VQIRPAIEIETEVISTSITDIKCEEMQMRMMNLLKDLRDPRQCKLLAKTIPLGCQGLKSNLTFIFTSHGSFLKLPNTHYRFDNNLFKYV